MLKVNICNNFGHTTWTCQGMFHNLALRLELGTFGLQANLILYFNSVCKLQDRRPHNLFKSTDA